MKLLMMQKMWQWVMQRNYLSCSTFGGSVETTSLVLGISTLRPQVTGEVMVEIRPHCQGTVPPSLHPVGHVVFVVKRVPHSEPRMLFSTVAKEIHGHGAVEVIAVLVPVVWEDEGLGAIRPCVFLFVGVVQPAGPWTYRHPVSFLAGKMNRYYFHRDFQETDEDHAICRLCQGNTTCHWWIFSLAIPLWCLHIAYR